MKKTLSLTLAVLMLAFLCVSFVSCGKSFEEKIVGTWTTKVEEAGITIDTEMTFEEGGKYSATAMGMTVSGTWKVVDDKTIEVTQSILGIESTEKMTVVFDGDDKMTATDSKGVAQVLTRKK